MYICVHAFVGRVGSGGRDRRKSFAALVPLCFYFLIYDTMGFNIRTETRRSCDSVLVLHVWAITPLS